NLMAVGGGAVLASALPGCSDLAGSRKEGATDFYFVPLSDTHWGYKGPDNPNAHLPLATTVATVNALETRPDFIVFTGDLTHTTDDPAERRARMAQFKEIVAELKIKTLRLLPGEHDASLDRGEAYIEAFGPTHYAFDHKGVHFVAIDNVSEASGLIGEAQLEWLAKDL